jgi:DNA topoisomerase IA
LASISIDAVLENTKVSLQLGKFELSLKGVTIQQQGFMEVANWVKSDDKVLENFTKGTAVNLSGVVIEESRFQVMP